MKSKSIEEALISVPYFVDRSSVSTPRYRWESWNRGEEPFVILQWTLSGEGIFEDERGKARVPPGHAFVSIVPERASYYYPPEGREPWVFGWVNFYGPLACTLFHAFRLQFGPVVFLSSRGAAATTLRRLKGQITRGHQLDRWQAGLHAYTFLLEWWREASEPGKGSVEGLERAVRFCRDHFREQLGVKEIACESGLSREHFTRLFSKHMRETPAAFLRRLRLREAETFLLETTLPLEEVALRSGFYSMRHLLRTFQRAHKQNPSEFRRRKARH